ncbi:glycosyltransferase family 4 protein [Myxococcus sp. CA033]|uniref:glycosyltransferase family 4 protein n=1 Tax=Myxococcus sp. CA033 TaxID=2741516 RepID=UPI00157AB031|nr:glycosyltransferase family 4 protein [Myxococcus sp. CA033]NTX41488.1 glycosyltransferase family 4 protein [Myxococcus sp. CA033]
MTVAPFRLGMLIPEFPTQTHAFFWREITALRAAGVEVHIFSTRRPVEGCPHEWAERAASETTYLYPPRLSSALLSPRDFPGMAKALAYVSRLSVNVKQKARALGMLACAVDFLHYSRERKLDHIHGHSAADAAHVLALCRILGGPRYSFHLHGDLPVYGTDHAAKAWDATFVAAAARPMQRELIEDVGLPPERTYTLWMGVDTDRFVPPPQRVESPRGLHLVSVGRLHLCKGHVHTFAALRKALDRGLRAHLTVGGRGPHEQEIRQSIARFGLEPHVKLVGPLGESAVIELLHGADAFVLSSIGLGEASPVAVMEAMACGVPPVCSIIGGTPDMISDGAEGLLVAQGDEEGLANAFLRLGQDVALRERMARAARERAVRFFDYRETGRRLLDAIHASRAPQRQAAWQGAAPRADQAAA